METIKNIDICINKLSIKKDSIQATTAPIANHTEVRLILAASMTIATMIINSHRKSEVIIKSLMVILSPHPYEAIY